MLVDRFFGLSARTAIKALQSHDDNCGRLRTMPLDRLFHVDDDRRVTA
jgi:hypothetical protein